MNDIKILKKQLAEAQQIIESQQALIDELEEARQNAFFLPLFELMKDIFQDKKFFPYDDLSEIDVIDPVYNDKTTIEVKASDIVCIKSVKGSRKKNIYIIEPTSGQKIKVRKYTYDNNKMNFNSLCEHLDKLSRSLVVVSKSAIVNVRYFEKSNGNSLVLNQKLDGMEKIGPIALSRKIGYENFIKIKERNRYELSLQKRVLDYKNQKNIPD